VRDATGDARREGRSKRISFDCVVDALCYSFGRIFTDYVILLLGCWLVKVNETKDYVGESRLY
jgi:hypothetical protein